ncbi:endoglucanase-4 [Abortiporus biennis]|nr:endoglucanase-4 [Abortiporus biennis]
MSRASTFFVTVIALLTLIPTVSAHGYVPQMKIGNQYIPGWDPNRVVRATPNDSGYIADPTSADITCSIGNRQLPTAPITASVPAGGQVVNYMAKCTGSCSTFKGDTGTPWFKIQQESYSNGIWASDALANNNHSYTVNIPSSIAPGEYLLRHEILALHGATNIGGAQVSPFFYPGEWNEALTVTGGGSKTPSGLAFPGAYSPTDPGIHFNPYQGDAADQAYVAPGGPVYPGL